MRETKGRCVCRAALEAEPATIERAVREHQRRPEHQQAWREEVERIYLRAELVPSVRRVA